MRGSKKGADTPLLFELAADEPEDDAPATDRFVEVALNRPLRRQLTYALPDELAERVGPGMRVAVPLGRSRQVGVVVAVTDRADVPRRKLRDVLDVLDREPPLGTELLGLTRWIAERYACSWGEALSAVLPAPLKRERGLRKVTVVEACVGVGKEQLAELEERFPKQHRLLRTLLEIDGPIALQELLRTLNVSASPAQTLERRGWIRIRRVTETREDEVPPGPARIRPEQLTPEQAIAVKVVGERLERREFGGYLLQGVTGSGKTEVYLRVIERALALGRTAIVLVPEIALTPQTVSWFRSRFGDVAVLHSRLTDSQRLRMWMRLAHGEVRVVVGARSAVFAPLADLGVIVVDEEHEPSFKQGSVPRYHAREVALERARREGAVCILGSATPSLEAWKGANDGDLRRLTLARRVGGGTMPTIHVVDMRGEGGGQRGAPLFSRLLRTFLEETFRAGEQAILFLNRRGFIPVLWCAGCGSTVRCEQCDLGMTFHRRIGRLVCHSCCEERTPPAACPTCSRPGLRALGVGSERVEHELRALHPDVRMRRMDSDTMRRREDYEETLDLFGRRELDVLVGTQMIAKGLDFPNVTLVGIVSADQALWLPDFRAAERTFQLVAQVAGRAGRGELPGRIVVQTVAPEHAAIRHAAHDDYAGFVKQEDALRAELGYPPHGRLLRVVFESHKEADASGSAEECARLLRERLVGTRALVLGPAPCAVALLRNRHRHHLLVKAPADEPAFAVAVDLMADTGFKADKRVDVDPMSMM